MKVQGQSSGINTLCHTLVKSHSPLEFQVDNNNFFAKQDRQQQTRNNHGQDVDSRHVPPCGQRFVRR